MEEQFERERSAKVRERYIDEKGGHGGAVPAAFSESTVWRSVLLGARATVSAKAAAGNLLVRPRIVPPFPSFLLLSPHICFVILNSLIAAVSHAIFSHCFSPANRCYYRRCIFETVPTANRHPVSGLPLFVSTASPSC